MHVFASIASGIATLVAAGFLYQRIGAHRDRLRYANTGRWVKIGNGCQLYLVEKGSGRPTVLFEAGIAATNLNWCHIQNAVSQFTHTASYDRCGLGWSSPCTSVRTPTNIAIELHAMLEAAGLKPPYILVGHSFGGLVMRRFALSYPEEIAGVVLVDPMRCEEWPPLDPSKLATLNRGKKMTALAIPIAYSGLARLAATSLLCRSGRISRLMAGAAGDGGVHVLGRIQGEVGKMPRKVWPAVAAHWSRPGYYAGMFSHLDAVPDTVSEMQNAGPILGTPVTLLTPRGAAPLYAQQLSQIGNNARQVIASASAHWIHLDEPDLVIDAIRDMVKTTTPEAVAVSV